MVCFESQTLVGLNRIETGVLQLVSLQLGHEADPAPFLLFIDKNACVLAGNHRKRQLQLLTAITAQRAKHIACEALRMNSHQRWRGMDVAHDQGNSLFRLAVLSRFEAKSIDAELSPAGREVSRGKLFRGGAHQTIIGVKLNWRTLRRPRLAHSPTAVAVTPDPLRKDLD